MLDPDAKVHQKVNDVFDKSADVIPTIFEGGKQTGRFVREVDSTLLAFSVLSAFAGAVTRCHSERDLQFADLIHEIKQQTIARLTDPDDRTVDREA